MNIAEKRIISVKKKMLVATSFYQLKKIIKIRRGGLTLRLLYLASLFTWVGWISINFFFYSSFEWNFWFEMNSFQISTIRIELSNFQRCQCSQMFKSRCTQRRVCICIAPYEVFRRSISKAIFQIFCFKLSFKFFAALDC